MCWPEQSWTGISQALSFSLVSYNQHHIIQHVTQATIRLYSCCSMLSTFTMQNSIPVARLCYVHACVLSRFSRVQLCVTLWTSARQAPLSIGFSRQEHWSGLPCPPPRDLPDLHWQVGSLPLVPPGKPRLLYPFSIFFSISLLSFVPLIKKNKK